MLPDATVGRAHVLTQSGTPHRDIPSSTSTCRRYTGNATPGGVFSGLFSASPTRTKKMDDGMAMVCKLRSVPTTKLTNAFTFGSGAADGELDVVAVCEAAAVGALNVTSAGGNTTPKSPPYAFHGPSKRNPQLAARSTITLSDFHAVL